MNFTKFYSINQYNINKGDLLFCCNGSHEILDVSGKSQWKFDHVAIAVDSSTIIESTPYEGVALKSLHKFINSRKVFVAQVHNKQLAEKAAEIASRFVGMAYNHTFSDNCKNGLYCSQLITTSFKIANNNMPYFKEDTLNFLDKNGNLPDFWIQYFKRYNMNVPQGKSGSHPSRLFEDKKIVRRCLLSDLKINLNRRENISLSL